MSRAIVVQGEASESEDEPEIVATFASSEKSNVTDKRFGLRVAGEASESEDEDEAAPAEDDVPVSMADSALSGPRGRLSTESHKSAGANKNEDGATSTFYDNHTYNTLLHKKLKEKNAMFHKRIIDTAAQVYLSAAKDMYNTTQQLWKLQSTVQDVSFNMRSLTNDLFYLEDRIDIIATCNLLPIINI